MKNHRVTLAALPLIVAAAGCASSACSEPRRADPRGEDDRNALVAELRAENEALRGKLKAAEERAERLEYVEKALDVEPRKLIEAYRETRCALKEKERMLAQLDDCTYRAVVLGANSPPVPAIDARVTAVKRDVQPGLVLLAAGSDDKVEKGFHFSVYRGSVFVGKVVVEKVLRDSCGCRVLFTKEGESIQVGDAAATRLQ
ncbi:MAG: hypothetical protein ACAI25_12795 [Planctomycetota bacterium]